MSGRPGFRAGRDQGAVTENMELLTGQRGDGLDKAVTLRDLADLGVATLRRAGNRFSPLLNPNLTKPFDRDAQLPTSPTGFMASGAFHNIILAWDPPLYRGHAYTEVWRAPVDNLAEAVMVGATNANLYADATGTSLTAWYWIRFVNVNDVRGPYTGPGGQRAETSRAIDDILEEMAGQISESELTEQLRETIGDLDSLWSAKASAGQITAGIGLLARPDGTTEAAVAAGRFYVFNPNVPTTKSNIFVVEGGNVYMNTAFIKQAFIEQVAAGIVTADLINALNLNAVNITGGQIEIGNNFAVDSAGNLIAKNMTAHNTTLTGTLTAPNGAIKQAMIGVAEVDTLRLAGQAVTFPASSFSAGSISVGGSWVTLASISGSFSGSPVEITCSAITTISLPSSSNNPEGVISFRILLDGSVIWSGEVHSFQDTQTLSWAPTSSNSSVAPFKHTPTAGTHTYTLQASRSGGASGSAKYRFIRTLETKR